MVAQIGPLVQEGRRFRAGLGHVLGGLAGGLTAGILIGFCGALLHSIVDWRSSAGLAALLATLTLCVGADAGLLRLRAVGVRRQTPESWKCLLGQPLVLIGWGFDLGTGMTTRLVSYTFLGLPAYAIFVGDFLFACLAFAAFGTARSLSAGFLAVSLASQASHAQRYIGNYRRILTAMTSLGGSLTILAVVAVLA